MREEGLLLFLSDLQWGLALWVWGLPVEIWSSYIPRVPSPLATLQPLPGLTIIHQWLSWQGHSMLHVFCPHRALVLSLGPHSAFLPSVRSSLLPLYHHSFCRSTFGSPAPWDLCSAHTHTTSHWLATPICTVEGCLLLDQWLQTSSDLDQQVNFSAIHWSELCLVLQSLTLTLERGFPSKLGLP